MDMRSCCEPDQAVRQADAWSDLRDDSGYSAEDLISLGFVNSPTHMKLVEESKPLAFRQRRRLRRSPTVEHRARCTRFGATSECTRWSVPSMQVGKVTAVICHATCVLLKTRLSDGSLLVDGNTWTGFANSEERYADDFVGKKIQPF